MTAEACPLVIKICGITSLADAEAALEAGADMLGFNFYPGSQRYIDPARCHEIVRGLKALRKKTILVGVFVNASLAVIQSIIEMCGLHLIQLSGDEPPHILAGLGGAGFKALRIKEPAQLQAAVRDYPARAFPPAFLIDACSPGEYGGTGHQADWPLAACIAQQLPVLLAGGLTPDNVALAVATVHPWGVDVASGVEASPGVKDYARLHSFVQQARGILNDDSNQAKSERLISTGT